MADGWCRKCEGFGHPASAHQTRVVTTGVTQWQETDERPLDSDEAYDVDISKAAVDQFLTNHAGNRQAAEVQIRSLLEDLLAPNARAALRHPETGRWRLVSRRAAFSLILNRDASAVIGYKSQHAERTYAQVKAGVPSRQPRSRSRLKKWFAGPLTELPFVIGLMTTRIWAREELGSDVTSDNASEVVKKLAKDLEEHGVLLPTQEGESSVTDSAGRVWTFDVVPEQRPYITRIDWGAEH
ncbi:hypothetical protein [Streptomyces sp. NPDC054865]